MSTPSKILIVDDEKIVCDMAQACFEHDGHRVVTFTDSTQALATLQKEQFDVLITDLKMKDVDGLQLLEFTRHRWPRTKVIILTAFPTAETAVESFRKQAFDYFTKPVRIDELKASVERALAKSNDEEREESHGKA